MTLLINGLVIFIALLHCYFLVLEMFFWDKLLGRKTFKLSAEFATASKSLAANQGLYNGFLAAGLVWGLVSNTNSIVILSFFLTCIIIAGIYGGITVGKKILIIQALPAAITLSLLLLQN